MSDMPAAGTVAKLGAAVLPADFATARALNEAGYDALVGMQNVGRRTKIGALGNKSNSGTYATHDDRRENTVKTTKINTDWVLTCAWDVGNAGQQAAIAGGLTDNWHPVIVEFPDAPAGGTPTTAYFHVLIMDTEVGEADAAGEKVDLVINCKIMTEILFKAAAAAP